MNILMVGYDLNKSGQNYEKLIDRLKQYPNWWHHLDSTWLIKSAHSAKQARDELQSLIDTNDELLVIDVTGQAAAWVGFSDKASKWIRENL